MLVTPTMEHPKLLALEDEFVRAFLAKYDFYADAFREKAKQLGEDTATATPANLKYCVDSGLLKAAIDTEFFEGVVMTKDLHDSKITELLEKETSADNMTISYSNLDVIIKSELKMNMKIKMLVLACTLYSWTILRLARDIELTGYLQSAQRWQ